MKQHKIRLIGHNNNNIILHCSRALCVDYVIIIVICRALLKLHAVAPMISLCFYLCSFFLFHSIEAGSTFRISQTFVPLHCVANDHLLLSAVASACSLHLAVLWTPFFLISSFHLKTTLALKQSSHSYRILLCNRLKNNTLCRKQFVLI